MVSEPRSPSRKIPRISMSPARAHDLAESGAEAMLCAGAQERRLGQERRDRLFPSPGQEFGSFFGAELVPSLDQMREIVGNCPSRCGNQVQEKTKGDNTGQNRCYRSALTRLSYGPTRGAVSVANFGGKPLWQRTTPRRATPIRSRCLSRLRLFSPGTSSPRRRSFCRRRYLCR